MLKTAASKVAWVSPSSATGQALRRTIIASSPASTASPRAMSRPGSLIRSTLSPHLPRSPGLGRAKEEGKSTRFYYYYRCSNHMKASYDGCSIYRHYRAEELEEQVWQAVRRLLRNPERLRTGMDTVIEMHRSALRGRPELEAQVWLDELAQLDRKRGRYQEMATEEFITLEELREKLIDLQGSRTAAEQALEEVQGRAGRIFELERDRDVLLATYEAFATEEMDELSPEERHDFYRTLRMIVYGHPEGGVEVTGEFMPFGEPDPRDPPSENGPECTPRGDGTGPVGNDAGSASRGFSTDKNTPGSDGAARARRASAGRRGPGRPEGRRPSAPRAGCRGRPRAARPPYRGET